MAIKKAVVKVKRIPDPGYTLDEVYLRWGANNQLSMRQGSKQPVTCEPINFKGQNMHNPLTRKGRKIMGAMQKQYGAKKGKSVFYASKNARKISGVD